MKPSCGFRRGSENVKKIGRLTLEFGTPITTIGSCLGIMQRSSPGSGSRFRLKTSMPNL